MRHRFDSFCLFYHLFSGPIKIQIPLPGLTHCCSGSNFPIRTLPVTKLKFLKHFHTGIQNLKKVEVEVEVEVEGQTRFSWQKTNLECRKESFSFPFFTNKSRCSGRRRHIKHLLPFPRVWQFAPPVCRKREIWTILSLSWITRPISTLEKVKAMMIQKRAIVWVKPFQLLEYQLW